jgi:hypothetical protein
VDVWNKREEESVGHTLVPVPTKGRDIVEFLPSWYYVKSIAGVGLGVDGKRKRFWTEASGGTAR